MSLSALAAVGTVGSVLGPTATTGVAGVAGTAGSSAAGDFAAQLGRGLERLQGVQDKADNLAVQAATGTLTDAHDYLIASTEAALTTQLTVAVRNKALEAFAEIMRMQA